MKKYFYFILFLTYNLINAQSLKTLDDKFGIKQFKLESNFEQYKSNLKFEFDADDGSRYYSYTGSDLKELLGVEVSQILLSFYKDKLYYIKIIYTPKNQFFEIMINQKLIGLFGKTETKVLKKQYDFQYTWETYKTYLEYIKFRNDWVEPQQLEIRLYSKAMKQQVINDGF